MTVCFLAVGVVVEKKWMDGCSNSGILSRHSYQCMSGLLNDFCFYLIFLKVYCHSGGFLAK